MSSNYLTADNGVSSGVTGITQSAGNDGTLQIRTTTSGGTATTAVTVDNAQNVGLGVTPNTWTGALKALQIGTTASLAGGSGEADLYCNAYNNGTNIIYQTSSYASQFQMNNLGQFRWYIAPSGTAGNAITFTQAMTLDVSGNLLVGTTSNPGVGKIGIQFSQSTNQAIALQNTSASNSGNYINFYNSSGTLQGYIGQTNSTTTAYVTSSDYRLKENVQPMTGALAKVVQLNPCTYTWKDNGFEGEGFIAHELAEVCHHAVVGEKDAVDANGNPVYQGIDTSFLVATLTAAIQELSAQVTSLKATVETQATTIATLQNKIGA